MSRFVSLLFSLFLGVLCVQLCGSDPAPPPRPRHMFLSKTAQPAPPATAPSPPVLAADAQVAQPITPSPPSSPVQKHQQQHAPQPGIPADHFAAHTVNGAIIQDRIDTVLPFSEHLNHAFVYNGMSDDALSHLRSRVVHPSAVHTRHSKRTQEGGDGVDSPDDGFAQRLSEIRHRLQHIHPTSNAPPMTVTLNERGRINVGGKDYAASEQDTVTFIPTDDPSHAEREAHPHSNWLRTRSKFFDGANDADSSGEFAEKMALKAMAKPRASGRTAAQFDNVSPDERMISDIAQEQDPLKVFALMRAPGTNEPRHVQTRIPLARFSLSSPGSPMLIEENDSLVLTDRNSVRGRRSRTRQRLPAPPPKLAPSVKQAMFQKKVPASGPDTLYGKGEQACGKFNLQLQACL